MMQHFGWPQCRVGSAKVPSTSKILRELIEIRTFQVRRKYDGSARGYQRQERPGIFPQLIVICALDSLA